MIYQVLLALAAVTFTYLVLTTIELLIGFSLIKNLKNQTNLDQSKLPSISIIFGALNEEDYIEEALESLLNIDYPNFEIIAINDRSTDSTHEIMQRLQQRYQHLKIIDISELPKGWFGKNHALHCGSQAANGEWLLFTDADVQMHPDTLSKAISYCREYKLDHLTIHERHLRNTFWLKVLMLAHYTTYSMINKPWRIRYGWSNKSLGHGAFNLVNAEVYKKCNGHRNIALECFDDLKLGALIKDKGFRQDTVDGCDYIKREWYSSLRDMIKGWEKNCFALYDYQPLPLISACFFGLVVFIWPFVAIFLFSGILFWLNLGSIILTFLISIRASAQYRLPTTYAIFYPVAILILLYAALNSMLVTNRNKGVTWRGTHYSLDELKEKKANMRVD